MNSSADPPRGRTSSVAGLLATVPHLLGFTPESSLVVVGVTRADRIQVALRYNLPNQPDSAAAAEITGHAMRVRVLCVPIIPSTALTSRVALAAAWP